MFRVVSINIISHQKHCANNAGILNFNSQYKKNTGTHRNHQRGLDFAL